MFLQLVNLIGNRVALMLNMAMLNLLFLTGTLVLEVRRLNIISNSKLVKLVLYK